MNDFQRGIVKAMLTSQLAIEKAALEAIKDSPDNVGNLKRIQKAKIEEIEKQLEDINKQS